MIANYDEFRYSIECLAKMYTVRERIKHDTTGYPEARQDEIDGVDAAIRKLEREVRQYLLSRYDADCEAPALQRRAACSQHPLRAMGKIADYFEFTVTIRALAKQYKLRDGLMAHGPYGDPDTHAAQIEGIEALMRKLEREIKEYVTQDCAQRLEDAC